MDKNTPPGLYSVIDYAIVYRFLLEFVLTLML